jgi:hypothetical protein
MPVCNRDQSISLIPQEFLVANRPGTKRAPARRAFLGPYPSMAAPFSYRELASSNDLGKLICAVPFFHGLFLNDQMEQRHYFIEFLFHNAPHD